MQIFKYLFTALVVIIGGGRDLQLAVSGFFTYGGISIAFDPRSDHTTTKFGVGLAMLCLYWFAKNYLHALKNVKESRLLPRMEAWYRLKWRYPRFIAFMKKQSTDKHF